MHDEKLKLIDVLYCLGKLRHLATLRTILAVLILGYEIFFFKCDSLCNRHFYSVSRL